MREVAGEHVASEAAGRGRDVAPMNEGFLGGPPAVFEEVGREQLAALLHYGLEPGSFLLDIGCGCLRGGRWIVPLLEAGHYCGIEPQAHMVERGVREFLGEEMARLKRPRFDHNDRFDFSVFGERFTHLLARSVWTHASKGQIEAMLDGAAEWGAEQFVFLASFWPARLFGGAKRRDYRGDRWIGRSHQSAETGCIAHSIRWIRAAARARGLEARVSERPPVHGQPWCVVTRR